MNQQDPKLLPVPLQKVIFFSKEQTDLGLHLGLAGHKYPHRNLGAVERQHMFNIHNKSPVRWVLIPPAKHVGEKHDLGSKISLFKKQTSA